MPWNESRVMDERARFVLAADLGVEPFAAVCRRFGISRQQGYKWLERWRSEGLAGLADRSRAPQHHPQATAPAVLEAALAVRRAHPTRPFDLGGPAKVRAALERRQPGGAGGQTWPAASTIGALFDREGLTVKRKLRRRTPPGGPLFAAEAANDVWTIDFTGWRLHGLATSRAGDFKGWFRTGDGTRVAPPVRPLDAVRRLQPLSAALSGGGALRCGACLADP